LLSNDSNYDKLSWNSYENSLTDDVSWDISFLQYLILQNKVYSMADLVAENAKVSALNKTPVLAELEIARQKIQTN